jgi:hypothetical protein
LTCIIFFGTQGVYGKPSDKNNKEKFGDLRKKRKGSLETFPILFDRLFLSLILQNLNYFIIMVIIVVVRKAICTQSPPRRSQVLHSASAA